MLFTGIDGSTAEFAAAARPAPDEPVFPATASFHEESVRAGCRSIRARSRGQTLDWSRRCPNPADDGREAVIEVRPR